MCVLTSTEECCYHGFRIRDISEQRIELDAVTNLPFGARLRRLREAAGLTIEGSTTKEVFEAYIEHFLAPTLREGQVVVVMDNLSAHKGERVRKLIEDRGYQLLYLPPYSPDLNPIEEAFSKVKRLLRAIGARTKEALVEAIGKELDVVGPWGARGFFTHCGYGGLE
jgi:transposase